VTAPTAKRHSKVRGDGECAGEIGRDVGEGSGGDERCDGSECGDAEESGGDEGCGEEAG
jgi:hypothetical protein